MLYFYIMHSFKTSFELDKITQSERIAKRIARADFVHEEMQKAGFVMVEL